MRAHADHRDGPPDSGPTPDPDRELAVAIVWLQVLLRPILGMLRAGVYQARRLVDPGLDVAWAVASVVAAALDPPAGYSGRNIRTGRRGSVAGWLVGILLILAILIILAVEVSRFFPFGFSLP